MRVGIGQNQEGAQESRGRRLNRKVETFRDILTGMAHASEDRSPWSQCGSRISSLVDCGEAGEKGQGGGEVGGLVSQAAQQY